MLRPKMLFQLVFSFLMHLSLAHEITPPIPLQCKNHKSTICIVSNVDYVDFRTPKLPDLTRKHTLQIRSGNMTRFSKELSASLGSVTKLQLGRLDMRSVWVKDSLRHLTAEGNQIQELVVDPSDSQYQMQFLNLMNNKLKKVRELKSLVMLKELRLSGNQLESLEMDTFAAMNQLKVLCLDRNEISQVSTPELVELPALELFSLAFNRLSKLNVNNWKMLQLVELELNNNQLVSLDAENFDQFVSLEKLSLAGNSWYCFWLSKALNEIAQKYVALIGRDTDCPGMPIEELCCSMNVGSEELPAYADLADRINLFELSQNRMHKELTQKVEQFGKSWSDNWGELSRVVKEKKEAAKNQLNDDNRVKDKDIKELFNMVLSVEARLNTLKELAEENASFAHEFTKLRYQVMDYSNKLGLEVKNATKLLEEMDSYKERFDGSVK